MEKLFVLLLEFYMYVILQSRECIKLYTGLWKRPLANAVMRV